MAIGPSQGPNQPQNQDQISGTSSASSSRPQQTMDALSSQPQSPTPQPVSELPPEAIALAGRLFDAARHGQIDIFEQALPRGLSANMTNDKGDSLIMLAAYHGHAPLVRVLLQHGADPNRLNDRGQSPLAGVVFKNEGEVIQALLQGGADPELGTPSAREACEVFRQEEYAAMFDEQTEKLRATGAGARNGH